MSWHVYPTGDEREHDTETTTCWCDPTVEPINGELLVTHNAADCRELVEQAEEIKNEHNT